MCANCVANVDAAAAAVGGLSGIWISGKAHLKLILTPSRIRVAAIAMSLTLVAAPFAVAFASA